MSTHIQITVMGVGNITWQGQASLLEALEDSGVDINYSCRAGICAACHAKLVSGEVSWRNQPILTLAENDILTCSVIPTSDIIIELPES
jgi:ferredoxin